MPFTYTEVHEFLVNVSFCPIPLASTSPCGLEDRYYVPPWLTMHSGQHVGLDDLHSIIKQSVITIKILGDSWWRNYTEM